jgi:hypothetical protein
MDTLISEIDAFLAAHPELSEWQFGDLAMGDRRFIPEVRKGREVRSKTVARARNWMAEYQPAREAA